MGTTKTHQQTQIETEQNLPITDNFTTYSSCTDLYANARNNIIEV